MLQSNIAYMLFVICRLRRTSWARKHVRTLVAGELEAPMSGSNKLRRVIDPTNIYSVLRVCKSCLHSLSSYFPGKVVAL